MTTNPSPEAIGACAGDLCCSLWRAWRWQRFCGSDVDGFAGREPCLRSPVWETVRGARDAPVGLLRDRWKKKKRNRRTLDDAARGVIRARVRRLLRASHGTFDRPICTGWAHLDNSETGRAGADRASVFGRAGCSTYRDVSASQRDQRVSAESAPRYRRGSRSRTCCWSNGCD